MAVELGGVSLEHLTEVAVREEARLARHPVPGMAGDLAQTLGRASVEVSIRGIFYGDSAADDLKGLRSAYLDQKPVDFFAEAVGEGYFAQVLIANLEIGQRSGYLDQFDFACQVVEYVKPPEPAVADPLAGIDTDLAQEAAGFMDDVQNAVAQVSQLADLVAGGVSFADPTTRLPGMLDQFTGTVSTGVTALTALKDLF